MLTNYTAAILNTIDSRSTIGGIKPFFFMSKKKKNDDNFRIVGNYVPLLDPPPEVKNGKRGGSYTEDVTKYGRPYRRFFNG